jgi:hypothetical protein
MPLITPETPTETYKKVSGAGLHVLADFSRGYVPRPQTAMTRSGLVAVRDQPADQATYDLPQTPEEHALAGLAASKGEPWRGHNPDYWSARRGPLFVVEGTSTPHDSPLHRQSRQSPAFNGRAAMVAAGFAGAAVLYGAAPAVNPAMQAQAQEPIDGTFYDIEGGGVISHWVSARQGAAADSMQSIPQYDLPFGSSSIPEDPQVPPADPTTWGGVKNLYRVEGPRLVRAQSMPRGLETLLDDNTIYFRGGSDYWSATVNFGQLTGPLHLDFASTPRDWTIPGVFSHVSMEPATIKRALYVGPGWYDDNFHWAPSAFPLPVDGTNFTPANQDTLLARSRHYAQKTGKFIPDGPFHYAPGQAHRNIDGVWWIFNAGDNAIQYTNINPDTHEIFAVTIYTKASGWINRNISECEMLKALGRAAESFEDSRYGITNSNPTSFNEYDAALICFILDKAESENQVRLIDMH